MKSASVTAEQPLEEGTTGSADEAPDEMLKEMKRQRGMPLLREAGAAKNSLRSSNSEHGRPFG